MAFRIIPNEVKVKALDECLTLNAIPYSDTSRGNDTSPKQFLFFNHGSGNHPPGSNYKGGVTEAVEAVLETYGFLIGPHD